MINNAFIVKSVVRGNAMKWRLALSKDVQEALLSLEYGVFDAVSRATIDIDRGKHRLGPARSGWAAVYMQEMLNHPLVAEPKSELNLECPFLLNGVPCVAGYLSELREEAELSTLLLSDPASKQYDRGPVLVTPDNDPAHINFIVSPTTKNVSDDELHAQLRKLLSPVLE